MGRLRKIVYLTEEQKAILFSTGELRDTNDNIIFTYNQERNNVNVFYL